jgi:Zn ribbon nucleic-acid-binding protein
MFWSWPVFDEGSPLPYLSWVNPEDLEIPFKRMNGENKFVASITNHIKKIADELIENAWGRNVINEESISDQNGFCVTFYCGLETLLGYDAFFSGFLKKLSKELNDFFAKLTESFLEGYKSSDIDEILKKIDKGKLNASDLETIRLFPSLKNEEAIQSSLKALDFTQNAINELIDIAKNRKKYADSFSKTKNELENIFKFDKDTINKLMSVIINKCQDLLPAWRKGFAYALVFEELNNEETKLKIVPAAYLGAGGVVEATGVVLKRPENAKLPLEQCKKKSKELYQLIEIINGKNKICPQCNKKTLRYWVEDWEEDRSRIVDPMYDLVEYHRKSHVMCEECGYKDTQIFTYYYDCRNDLVLPK